MGSESKDEDDDWGAFGKSAKKKSRRRRKQAHPGRVASRTVEPDSANGTTTYNSESSQITKQSEAVELVDGKGSSPTSRDTDGPELPKPPSDDIWTVWPQKSPKAKAAVQTAEPSESGSDGESVALSFGREAWNSQKTVQSSSSAVSDAEDRQSYDSVSVAGSGGVDPWPYPETTGLHHPRMQRNRGWQLDSQSPSARREHRNATKGVGPSPRYDRKPLLRRHRVGLGSHYDTRTRGHQLYSNSNSSFETGWRGEGSVSYHVRQAIKQMIGLINEFYNRLRAAIWRGISIVVPLRLRDETERNDSEVSRDSYFTYGSGSSDGPRSRPHRVWNRNRLGSVIEVYGSPSGSSGSSRRSSIQDAPARQSSKPKLIKDPGGASIGLPPFEYQHLETPTTIRLLKLIAQRGQYRLALSHHTLDGCPPFEAISYTWTDPDYANQTPASASVREIDCDGRKCEIPTNLFKALPAIAKVRKTEYLWADAVCINQNDDVEKGGQVMLMGDIYSQATRVIIWLGEADARSLPDFARFHSDFVESRKEFELIRGIGSLRGQDPLEFSFVKEFWPNGFEGWKFQWRQYFAFFQSRRWFRRVWIIQEVALARELVLLCGDQVVAWKEMTALGSFLRKHAWRHALAGLVESPHVSGIGDEADNLVEYQRQVLAGPLDDNRLLALFRNVDGALSSRERWFAYLQYLIQEGRRFQASVELDHIYGLIGLCQRFLPTGLESPFRSDYTTTPVELYSRITLHLLQELPQLSTLSLAVRSVAPDDGGRSDLPSWVPDYATPIGLTPLIHIGDGNIFNACSGHPKPNVDVVGQGHILQLRGASIGKVRAIFPADPDGKSEGSTKLQAKRWLQACQQLQAQHIPAGQSKVDVLWRTLMADTTERSPRIHPAPANYGAYFRQWITTMLMKEVMDAGPRERKPALRHVLSIIDDLATELGDLPALPTRQDISSSFVAAYLANPPSPYTQTRVSSVNEAVFLFHSAFKEVSHRRSLFVTADGRLGLGPTHMRPKDEVWLVPGSRVPFVLRKGSGLAAARLPAYQLVGECYVHGIMQGEAWCEEVAQSAGPLFLV